MNMKPPARHRALRRALPRRLAVQALLAARVARGLLLLLLGARWPAGAASRLDHARGVAAVLGLAFALGLSHIQTEIRRFAASPFRSPGPERPRGSGGWPPAGRPGSRRTLPAGASPTSSALHRRGVPGDRCHKLCQAASGGRSSTFVDTWATPSRCWECEADRPHGRQPLPPPSRISAAILRAVSSVAGGSSSTLNAISGWRALTSTAPPRGCSRRGPKSGVSSPASIRACSDLRAAAPDLGARDPTSVSRP